jgi:cytochrome c-type biogenesis protein CcmH/NrfG
LEIKPDSFSAYFSLGDCLVQEGDKKGAIAAFQKVVRIKPDLVEGHLRLASLLVQEGRDAEAEEALSSALRLAPENADAKKLFNEIKSRKANPPKP